MSDSISSFQFRGKRDYLHSTTVFDWVLAQNSGLTQIDFHFKKLTPNQVRIEASVGNDAGDVVALLRSDEVNLDFVETDQPMNSSYPCNEKEICEEVEFSEEAGTFSYPLKIKASFLEAIVAVYKEFLSRTPAGSKGKLLFGRVKLSHVPATGTCTVKHRREIGKGFFEASIYCEDVKIGALYFGQS